MIRRALLAATAALCRGLVAPRASSCARVTTTTVPRALDSSVLLADAEAALGGIVKFLPLIALPGVLVGIPYLVYQRLSDLEGEAYTETVFTDKDPPRVGAPVDRRRDEDLSYAELEDKYGRPTLKDNMGLLNPEPEPEPAPFSLPSFELPSFPSFEAPAPEPEPEAEDLYVEEPFKFPWQ